MITYLEYLHRRQLFYGRLLRPWVLAYFADPVYHGTAPDGSQPVISITNWDQVRDILPYFYRPRRVLSSGAELWPGPCFLSYYPLKFFAMFKDKAFKAASKIAGLSEFSDSPYYHTAVRVIILRLLSDAYQEGRDDQMAEYIRELDSAFH